MVVRYGNFGDRAAGVIEQEAVTHLSGKADEPAVRKRRDGEEQQTDRH
ncbi:MAG: hypothetical protein QOH74_1184, partial [Gaiellales bacterium]|nr:hypothetical protein [Gaiellales bacterium]